MYEFELIYFDENSKRTAEDDFFEELCGMIQDERGVWYVWRMKIW